MSNWLYQQFGAGGDNADETTQSLRREIEKLALHIVIVAVLITNLLLETVDAYTCN